MGKVFETLLGDIFFVLYYPDLYFFYQTHSEIIHSDVLIFCVFFDNWFILF